MSISREDILGAAKAAAIFFGFCFAAAAILVLLGFTDRIVGWEVVPAAFAWFFGIFALLIFLKPGVLLYWAIGGIVFSCFTRGLKARLIILFALAVIAVSVMFISGVYLVFGLPDLDLP